MSSPYFNVIPKEKITIKILTDVLILCIVVLAIRSLLLDGFNDHWLFGSVLEGIKIICGSALAAIIIINVTPKNMRESVSAISNSL